MYPQAAENMSSVWPSLYEKILDRLRTHHVKDKVIQKLWQSIRQDFDQQTTTGILFKSLCCVWAGAWFFIKKSIFFLTLSQPCHE